MVFCQQISIIFVGISFHGNKDTESDIIKHYYFHNKVVSMRESMNAIMKTQEVHGVTKNWWTSWFCIQPRVAHINLEDTKVEN